MLPFCGFYIFWIKFLHLKIQLLEKDRIESRVQWFPIPPFLPSSFLKTGSFRSWDGTERWNGTVSRQFQIKMKIFPINYLVVSMCSNSDRAPPPRLMTSSNSRRVALKAPTKSHERHSVKLENTNTNLRQAKSWTKNFINKTKISCLWFASNKQY